MRGAVERLRSALRAARGRISPEEQPRWLRVGAGTRIVTQRIDVRDPEGALVEVGERSNVECGIVIERAGARVAIGSRTHVGGGTVIDATREITIGDDVLVAFGVLFMDHDSHSLRFSERRNDVADWMRGHKDWSHVAMAPVHVRDKAWIGAHAIILKGVTVGEGGVVAAGAVVTRDVPPWTVVGGNPARVIRELGPEER